MREKNVVVRTLLSGQQQDGTEDEDEDEEVQEEKEKEEEEDKEEPLIKHRRMNNKKNL